MHRDLFQNVAKINSVRNHYCTPYSMSCGLSRSLYIPVTGMQSQKAVTAHLKKMQVLPFDFGINSNSIPLADRLNTDVYLY